MRRLASLLVLVLLAVSLASLPATAEEDDPREIHVVAHDEPASCVADEAPCYEIVDDGWSLVSAGERLHLTFENNASAEHALALTDGDNASEERDTEAEAAFAQLGPIAPGEQTNATIEIPPGTDTAYLFCHLADHEAEGLHLLRNVYPAGSVEEARQRGPGLNDPDETPGPLALLALALGALAIRRR